MKLRFLFLLLLLPIVIEQSAKELILEQSTRKVPVWIGASQPGFIITSAYAPSLEEAKRRCMENVKRSILESVAVNVTSSTHYAAQNNTINGRLDWNERFASEMKSRSANLPFLQGVSESRVVESFWQKRLAKPKDTPLYLYWIKFDYPRSEEESYIRRFQEYDHQMMEKLSSLETRLDSVTRLSDISSALDQLESLNAYFFDSGRIGRVEALQNRYRRFYDCITIYPITQTLGRYEYRILLNDRPLIVDKPPTFKSDGAKGFQWSCQADRCILLYDYTSCVYDTDYTLTMTHRFGSRYLSHRIEFNRPDDRPKVRPVGTILLTAASCQNQSLTRPNLRVNLEIRNCHQVTVRSLVLSIPNLVEPLIFDSIDRTFQKSGDHTLLLSLDRTVALRSELRSQTLFVKGTLIVEFDGSESPVSIPFTLPLKPSW